jgi:Fe/S biogenesis protein NfuA
VALAKVEGDAAYVRLGGGCQGCGAADVTLRQGIEEAIIGAVPEIRRVLDATDHAAGTNPYYAPSETGHSPLAQD